MVPRVVLLAFAVDLILVGANIVDLGLGFPIERLTRFIDLDGEANLPSWYASIQWFCVAALLWEFSRRTITRSSVRSWVLLLLPLIFVLFSLDEVAQLHEGFGGALDRLLLNVPRISSALPKTGPWFLLVGIPFVIGFALLIAILRPQLRHRHRAFTRLVLGMSLFLVGAVGVEAFSNVVVRGSTMDTVQVIVEESLEFLGSTIVLWGAWLLAQRPEARPDPLSASDD